MKSPIRNLLAALALGLALLPLSMLAAGPSPETRVARLDQLVGLASDQKAKAAEVFRKEDAELAALSAADRPSEKMFEIRHASRDRIRALLVATQQKIYDRAPQLSGGGLTLPRPENRVATLDQAVGLTAAQKTVALQIYAEEFESLLSLEPSERPSKGAPYRQASQSQVRLLLTPEQLNKMDGTRQAELSQANAERTAVEHLLRASANLAARIGPVVSFSRSGASSTTESSDGSRKGTYTVRVIGGTGSMELKVSWEKPSANAELRIVGVVDENKAAIGL